MDNPASTTPEDDVHLDFENITHDDIAGCKELSIHNSPDCVNFTEDCSSNVSRLTDDGGAFSEFEIVETTNLEIDSPDTDSRVSEMQVDNSHPIANTDYTIPAVTVDNHVPIENTDHDSLGTDEKVESMEASTAESSHDVVTGNSPSCLDKEQETEGEFVVKADAQKWSSAMETSLEGANVAEGMGDSEELQYDVSQQGEDPVLEQIGEEDLNAGIQQLIKLQTESTNRSYNYDHTKETYGHFQRRSMLQTRPAPLQADEMSAEEKMAVGLAIRLSRQEHERKEKERQDERLQELAVGFIIKHCTSNDAISLRINMHWGGGRENVVEGWVGMRAL
jgi:hypothetical protein